MSRATPFGVTHFGSRSAKSVFLIIYEHGEQFLLFRTKILNNYNNMLSLKLIYLVNKYFS
jgi:hypothetical protein